MFSIIYSYLLDNKIVNYFKEDNKNNIIDYNKYHSVLEFIPKINYKISDKIYDNQDLINIIHKFCINETNKKFIVSLSGGVDSMVLITIIKYLGYEVIGAHINYNNREETKEEQEFLEDWCSYNNIKLYIKTIEHIKRATCKRSDYETITKNMRLDFYKEIMVKENVDTILLAHHKDDIVENIFANVCRGRYLLDLAVIKEKSIINDIIIARPMISFYKQPIYDFADKYQVPYFKDTTPNWSVRGKYRNKILPIIEDTFTKNIKENLICLSEQSSEWNELVTREIINPFIENLIINNHDYETKIEFYIDKHLNYPLCFWNVIFMNIFNKFGYGCPSRKAIQTFINSINNHKNSPHPYYITLSMYCKCILQKGKIKITFKSLKN